MSISSILHNRVYIQSHCNDCRNPFLFACCKWYLYNQGILTLTYTNTIIYICRNKNL